VRSSGLTTATAARLVYGDFTEVLWLPALCKPTDNALIEAFNVRIRAEYLNAHWFLSLADARKKLEGWRTYDNEERPHGAIGQKRLRLACSSTMA